MLHELVPKRKLRRVDHFSRMALLAAGRAFRDASSESHSKQTTGVIVATGFGALKTTFDFLDSYIDKGDKLASPTHFSNSVHNAAGAHISICYGISGPNLTISQFDMSFISSLITAATWLAEKKATAVLIGSSDVFCDVLGYCINQLTSKKCPSYSFRENAVFYFLTSDETPAKYGYFDDITIGNFNHEIPQVPDDSTLVLSGSAVAPCMEGGQRFIETHKKKAIMTSRLNSPTDCSMNILLSKQLDRTISYVKIGQNDTFGRLSFIPV